MNSIIKQNLNCVYEDMYVFIDFIKFFNIKNIVEIDMMFNNFLYITYIYNQQNNKSIKYNLINPIINKDNYINIISDNYLEEVQEKFIINYSKPIKKNNLVIYNKYFKTYKTQYIIVPKNTPLDFINYYYMWVRSQNYYFLIDVKLLKKIKL